MRPTRRRATAAATCIVTSLSVLALLAGCGSSSSRSTPAAAQTSVAPTSTAAAGPTCPLTGATATAKDHPHSPPLAVKIDNVAPALPQAGVNSADIVFEELVEGGLTRLMAVFQCTGVPSVGPIRSARTTDADVLALLHGSIYAYSGANPAAIPPIQAHGDTVLLSFDALGDTLFHRDLSRPAPHNVFASTETLLKAGEAKRKSLTAPKPLFSYGAPASGGAATKTVSLHWPATTATWTRSASKGWLRTQDGAVDHQVGGKRIDATNVVILDVTEGSSGLHDVLGNASPVDETVGSGDAWVLRGGRRYFGHWKRSSVTSPLHLTTADGSTLTLAPGHTWVELLPKGTKPTFG